MTEHTLPSKATDRLFKIDAEYSDESGYFGDTVIAPDQETAERVIRAVMKENGDLCPSEIKIIDCIEVSPIELATQRLGLEDLQLLLDAAKTADGELGDRARDLCGRIENIAKSILNEAQTVHWLINQPDDDESADSPAHGVA